MPKQCLTYNHIELNSESDSLKNFSLPKDFLLAGRYRIIQEISRGVLGILYQVNDTELDNESSHLKILHPIWNYDPIERQRFTDEINLCIDPIDPPQIQVDHLEYGQAIHFYVSGPPLKQHMHERKGTVPPFSLTEIRIVILALLDTLDYLHQYTVHLQISPSTVIIFGSFPKVSIRLLDFSIGDGVSSFLFNNNPPPDTASLLYMAPEQVKAPQATDPRSDLYSVGVILYEMLTGEKAVGAFEMPSSYLSNAYEPLDKVIRKVLYPNVDLRYSTAMAFSNAISDALNKIEQTHEGIESRVTGSSKEEYKTVEHSAAKQHRINHTRDALPEKEAGKTNALPGKRALV